MAETVLLEREPVPQPIPATSAASLHTVARQPIMDASGRLHAYELLFRQSAQATVFQGDGVSATRSVLDNSVLFGLEHLTAGKPAFINCTQESLERKLVTVLPPRQAVLEILETLNPTDELFNACISLKADGYKFALDDFLWTPEWDRFIPLADYIKIDWSITPAPERIALIHRARQLPIRFIAERVETQQEFETAKAEGFHLFQGYYFCRPVLIQHPSVPANRLVHIEMLSLLQDPVLNTPKVAALTKRDAALTFRLLRIANSALYGTSAQISSIQQALVMVGDLMFRRVAMLAIANELGGGHNTELLRMAYTRSRFCELAAPLAGLEPSEQYLLGLLSLLPAMLHVNMETFVNSLTLRPWLRAALLGEVNPQGRLLTWLLAYESAQWLDCDAIGASSGLDTRTWPRLYTEAIAWAEGTLEASRR